MVCTGVETISIPVNNNAAAYPRVVAASDPSGFDAPTAMKAFETVAHFEAVRCGTDVGCV